jgi:hypothetical protein
MAGISGVGPLLKELEAEGQPVVPQATGGGGLSMDAPAPPRLLVGLSAGSVEWLSVFCQSTR